jgi:6-phosphogluconolactonase (cycloisomerase 2 family)
MRSRRLLIALVLASALSLITSATALADGNGDSRQRGAVYTLSNEATGNAVIEFARDRDGELTQVASYPTGGLGSGTSLGSQGAVVLSRSGRWLVAVNAGSDEISVFAVTHRGLRQTDRIGSGGDMPISVTIHRQTIYVLNAGGDGNIAGFRLGRHGELWRIGGSTRPLSTTASAPAQIEFTPDGRRLVVTEKDANAISTYRIGRHGQARGPIVTPSSGMTPFGFAFDHRGHLIVSEAFGGTPGASAVSSYKLGRDGMVKTLSASVGTTQTAACWTVVVGRFAYVTNTGSGTVSSYVIERDGEISLRDADAGLTGDGSLPIDAAVSDNGRFVYVLGDGTDEITAFRVGASGALTEIDADGGLPSSAVGLAAR